MTRPRAPEDDGFALVTALWAALLLALLASYIVMASRTDARIMHTAITQARQRAAADGLIELVKLRLLGPEGGTVPLDGTPIPVTYVGYRAAVRVQDQAGLIDLNFADHDTLAHVLTVLGRLDSGAADAMADRILDWREQGAGRRLNGAKAPEYLAGHYPYGPREGSFASVAELKLVLGMTGAVFDRLAPALTVQSQKQIIDPTTAPRAVLLTLPGMTEDLVDAALRDREAGVGSVARGPQGITAGTAVSIAVTLSEAVDRSFVQSSVVRATGMAPDLFWTYDSGASY